MEEKSLSTLRKENNLTQRQLAKLLGLSAGAIAMYELGTRTPSLKVARKIACFFDVPIEAISFGKITNKMLAKKEDESVA